MGDRTVWTPQQVDELRKLYLVEGRSGEAVAAYFGVTRDAVIAKSRRMGWERPVEFRGRNLSLTMAAKFGVKVKAGPRLASAPLNTYRAPVNYKAPEKPPGALPDRIAAALKVRGMSAPTLATVLDEKELYVSIQLAAMADAGTVVAGPASETGLRHRVWRLAA